MDDDDDYGWRDGVRHTLIAVAVIAAGLVALWFFYFAVLFQGHTSTR